MSTTRSSLGRPHAWVVVLAAAGLALAGFAFWPARDCQGTITRGPVLTALSGGEAALVWETDTPGVCRAIYVEQSSAGAGNDAAGGARSAASGAKPVAVASAVTVIKGQVEPPLRAQDFFEHRATLKGLQPGRSYAYHIEAGAKGEFRTPRYVFKTPAAEIPEIVFAVYGDSQHSLETHRAIVEQIAKFPVQFVVRCGDLVDDGQVYSQWQSLFLDCLKGLGERVPIFAVKGNHDAGYYERICLPIGRKNDYSFDWGPLHFVCLDNSLLDNEGLDFATRDLQANKSTWRFVVHHRPTLNLGGHSSDWEYPKAVKLWDAQGIDMVFSGHSHIYERFRPVVSSAASTHATTYITTGGGGSRLYAISDIGSSKLLAATERVHHFCIVTIKGPKLTMQVITVDGQTIDRLEFEKTPAGLSAAYLKEAVLIDDLDQGISRSTKDYSLPDETGQATAAPATTSPKIVPAR